MILSATHLSLARLERRDAMRAATATGTLEGARCTARCARTTAHPGQRCGPCTPSQLPKLCLSLIATWRVAAACTRCFPSCLPRCKARGMTGNCIAWRQGMLGLGRAMSLAACCTCPRAVSLTSETYRCGYVVVMSFLADCEHLVYFTVRLIALLWTLLQQAACICAQGY